MNGGAVPTTPLSRPKQLTAQRRYLSYAMFNPLGANLTIGPVSALLALHYGANDLQMGLLFASIYLAGVFAVLAPALFQGIDASRVSSRSWWIRSVIAGSILLFPFIPDAALKAWLLIIVLFLFLSIRAVGVSTLPSVLRAISGPRELTTMNAEAFFRWHVGCLITALLAWGVLSQRQRTGDENAFIVLFAVGFVFNLITSQRLSGLPLTGGITGGSLRALPEAVEGVIRKRPYREVVWVTLLQVPMTIAAAYQINALKSDLGYTPEVITALTVAGIVVSIAGARALVLIGARIPVRPLLLGSHIVLFLLGASWTWLHLFPASVRGAVAGILFVFGTMFLAVSGIVLAALSNERLPRENAVSCSVIYQLAGVIAAVLGIVLVMGLGAALPPVHFPGMHSYSHAFFVWTVLSLGVCIFALVMVKGRLGIFAHDLEQVLPANLMAVFRAHDMTVHASSRPSEVREFENVLTAPVPAGERLVLEALRHPEARHRAAAYRALYEHPLPSSITAVVAEAENRDSPLRGEAVNALGFLHIPAATAALRTLGKDKDPDIRSKAYKGLLRHGEPMSRAAILRDYRTLRETRHRMDMLWGILAAERSDVMWDALAFEMSISRDPAWMRIVFIILAEALGDKNRMGELFASERDNANAAFTELLAELPDPAAGASICEWRTCVSADGRITLPAAVRFPRALIPKDITCLIGLLHCSRLQEQLSLSRRTTASR